MCISEKTQLDIAKIFTDKIQDWFTGQIEMDNENFMEDLLTQNELIARSEVRESCANFMTDLFMDMSKKIEMEVIE